MAKSPAKPPALDASARFVILHGKDRFLEGLYSDQIRGSLIEVHGIDGVDTLRFDGATAQIADILDECRSFGLMQQHKLVIVDNADLLVRAEEGKPPRGHVTARQALESYAAAPGDGATLILRGNAWRPGNLDKAVAKIGAVVKCDHPTDREAASWARARSEAAHGAKLSPDAARAMIEHLGTDLGRIDSELAKLAISAPGEPIDVARVREHVGVSREEEFWSIQEALLSGDPSRALRQLRDLVEISRHDPVAITWSYMDLARKLHTASRMLSEGSHAGTVSKHLRLWGASGDAIMRIARRLHPLRAAALFKAAVETDANQKSGLGFPLRNLETLTIRFTSVIG